jgi:hypothetical protein
MLIFYVVQTSTNWLWISTAYMCFAFRNRITESTSQSTELVIHTVPHKALLRSNKVAKKMDKRSINGHNRFYDDSSRPPETSGQCPARAGCANILILRMSLVFILNI